MQQSKKNIKIYSPSGKFAERAKSHRRFSKNVSTTNIMSVKVTLQANLD